MECSSVLRKELPTRNSFKMYEDHQAISVSKIDIGRKIYRCYTLNNGLRVLSSANGQLPDLASDLDSVTFYKGNKKLMGYELNAFMNTLVDASKEDEEPLSSFNAKLKQALNFDPKNNKTLDQS